MTAQSRVIVLLMRARGFGLAGAALGILAVVWLSSVGRSWAEGDSTAPPLLVGAPKTIEFKAHLGGLLASNSESQTARGSVVINTAASSDLKITGYFSDGSALPGLAYAVDSGEPVSIVRISFLVDNEDPVGGQLVFSSSQSTTPQSADFMVERVVTASVLAKPVAGAALLPLVFLIVLHRYLKGVYRRNQRELHWSTELRVTDAKWSFSESWASNITAVGAVLGTVLAAGDFIDDSLSGLSLTGFVGLSLLFGFVALFAPMIFSAFFRNGKATYVGLILSAYVTCFALVGQLSTLAIMLHRGGTPQAWGMSLMVLAWVVVGFYLWRSIYDLVVPDPGEASKISGVL